MQTIQPLAALRARVEALLACRHESSAYGAVPEAIWTALSEIAATIAREVAAREELERVIEGQSAELRGLTLQLTRMQESERQSIARELHDRIGQSLTVLGFSLHLLSTHLPPETSATARRLLDDAVRLGEETGTCIRDVMAELRPPVLDDYGLVAALRWHGQQVEHRTGIEVVVEERPQTPRLEADVEIGLFRVAQEALLNVERHARATKVIITVTSRKQEVQVTIADNGTGFDPEVSARARVRPGWGMLGMRERVEAIGGTLQVMSSPTSGTTVTAIVRR